MKFKSSVIPNLPTLTDHWQDLGYSVPRYFTDEQLADLEKNPEYLASKDVPCVVCYGTGRYIYGGEEFDCPDDAYGHVIMRLVRLYWLHNIKLQYQQLDWNEWPNEGKYQQVASEAVKSYIENFPRGFRFSGTGLTFFAKGLGTGKTWGATTVLKELVKQGIDGWFAPFYEVKGYYEIPDAQRRTYLINRVQTSPLLVLDEVRHPDTPAQKRFYADKLEELVRPRTDANFPTIITTNMTPEQMEEEYPRIFSLMSAKNILVELNGSDARLGSVIWKRNTEAIANGESLPIV